MRNFSFPIILIFLCCIKIYFISFLHSLPLLWNWVQLYSTLWLPMCLLWNKTKQFLYHLSFLFCFLLFDSLLGSTRFCRSYSNHIRLQNWYRIFRICFFWSLIRDLNLTIIRWINWNPKIKNSIGLLFLISKFS